MLHALKIQIVYWPTLLWNVLLGRWLRLRPWWSEIDEEIVLGALPFRADVKKLYEMGVRGVINTCLEYDGPLTEYREMNMSQFHMPTVDFTEPKLDDIRQAVDFIEEQVAQGHRVYVHCKAGRARSATVVLCYLCKRDRASAQEIQQLLLNKRAHVNPKIKDRQVVQQFLKLIAAPTP